MAKPVNLLWGGIAALGAASLAVLALHRGESINALWLVTAALCVYVTAYRFYGRMLASRVVGLSATRITPAVARNDGLDFVPTPKPVLFGHHFAAIAGAGPLVGPVLAAQMGYLPGTLWLLAGVVFAGAVQDFLVLVFSSRRNARSLGEMIRLELGQVPGLIASTGILTIMVILIAVLALIFVKALANSPWGTFTVAATIPIGVGMGLYQKFLRPGRIVEMSALGIVLLFAAIWGGGAVAGSSLAGVFTLPATSIAWGLMAYGFTASVLPVWVLLAPRDYLSTFLKIGTIAALAAGILITRPSLHMPAISRFIDGSGPVFAGPVFPFLFITIACGAVSGFHALVSSGTTPKMLAVETDALAIGYGAMLVESMVGIMALCAACVLQPGAYFAMNAPAALVGGTVQSAAHAISGWGFVITPEALEQLAHQVGELTILGRAGGAPTLAVGMAQIFAGVLGGSGLMAFWYHFAILFEALFILTTIDAGTRVARFMIQDFLGLAAPQLARTESWPANLLATTLAVGGWGYFLYQGVTDPFGGINTLWPLFGIANQMLAAMALIFCTVVLVRMKRERFAWVPGIACAWLALCTLYAGWLKLASGNPAIGFLAHRAKFASVLASGQVLAPAKTAADMGRILANDSINASLIALFMAVVVAMLGAGLRAALEGIRAPVPSVRETQYVAGAGE